SGLNSFQAQRWVQENGNTFTENLGSTTVSGTEFDTVELLAGWTYDSRNRSLFADRGTRQQLYLGMAVPLGDVEYFTARYSFRRYFPLFGRWTAMLNADLSYGAALNDTTALPPGKQFFGGGPETVRGYKESWMGPRDSFG